jgi:hypothetical protein
MQNQGETSSVHCLEGIQANKIQGSSKSPKGPVRSWNHLLLKPIQDNLETVLQAVEESMQDELRYVRWEISSAIEYPDSRIRGTTPLEDYIVWLTLQRQRP